MSGQTTNVNVDVANKEQKWGGGGGERVRVYCLPPQNLTSKLLSHPMAEGSMNDYDGLVHEATIVRINKINKTKANKANSQRYKAKEILESFRARYICDFFLLPAMKKAYMLN